MDELIVRVLRGEETDFEVRQLDRWRKAAPEHEAEFRSVELLWAQSVEILPGEIPPPPPVSRILSEGNRRRRTLFRSGWPAGLRRTILGTGLSAAAVIALLILGVQDRNDSRAWTTLVPVETSSTVDDITTMGLSDGSVVRLAPGSRVEFPPSSGGRNVVMEGRAFFAVASGETPFVVRTGAGEVRVVGTRFEVMAEGGELRVAVLEGLVHVGGEKGVVQAGPDQLAFISGSGVPRVEEAGDLRTLLSWPGGLLLFQETPFSEVAREVADHFGVPFKVPGGNLADRRVTAWFGDESLEEVVQGVCMVVGARCEIGEEGVTAR